MKTIAASVVASILLSIPLSAQPVAPPPPAHDWCATSPANTRFLEERHERREARRVGIRSDETKRVIKRDGVFIVEADDSMLVNDDPLDLIGRTVRFIPAGTRYLVETVPIDYSDDIGDLAIDFGASLDPHHRIDLPFSFPFHGAHHDHLYITNRNGIYFDVPAPRVLNQYEAFDVAAIEQGVISPLLLGKAPATFVPPSLFIRSSADRIILTWRTDSTDFAYDVQTILAADGSISMSWQSARDVSWGAVVVTPGMSKAEVPRQSVVSLDDDLHDATRDRADQDLDRIEIERLDGSDLLEVRVVTRGAVSPSAIEAGEFVQYTIESRSGSMSRIVVHMTKERNHILLPGRGWISDPGSLRLESNTIRFLVTDRDLQSGESVTLNAWIWDSSAGQTIDTIHGSFSHSYSDDLFELDLSADSGRSIGRPVVESFTLPDMDPYAVWDLISREHGIDPSDTDALAIYQDFFTDLVLYAGAYSTVGNPGVDGVWKSGRYGTDVELFPALLHMSKLGYRYNTSDELSTHVLNHEFGHRWLYFFEIMEEGKSTHSLNPGGGHPAQFVHTPAAFDVLGAKNSSAMGGAWFEDLGDGTFRAADQRNAFGFSWHELYLMGLARPDEVEPWFYVADSEPRLGDAYFPPTGITVSGTRRDVVIDQLIASMGERNPADDRSRKRFSTYFVLLVRDLEGLSDAKVEDLHHRRRLLHESIPVATGGRATIKTRWDGRGPRLRGVRRP